MDRPLTSEELRIAAMQAITIALSMKEEGARKDLLSRAQRLLDESKSPAGFLRSS